MTTVWEKQTIDQAQAEEARKHNEMVHERYLRLQNEEDSQLAETFAQAEQAKNSAPAQFVAATPVENKTFVASPVRSESEIRAEREAQRELFTADTFRRVILEGAEKAKQERANTSGQKFTAPVAPAQVAPAVSVKAQEQEESYSLTSAAKAVVAAFAALVVLMLTVIGINTRIINAKGAELVALEERRAELVEESRELAARIAEATDEETIASWAQKNGWTK